MNNFLILTAILFPLISGFLILFMPANTAKNHEKEIGIFAIFMIALTIISTYMIIFKYFKGEELGFVLFSLTKGLKVTLIPDGLSVLFLSFISPIWLLCAIFSTEYLNHVNHKRRFWGFYLLVLFALQGLSMSANLVTMYFFFECMTLVSMPLVLHVQDHESIMAALKYMFYSMAGAYMALFGIFVCCYYTGNATFVTGGILTKSIFTRHPVLLTLAVIFLLVGFGVKAGLFPMHAWLPTAHPVAPAPASAVLSAVIVKSGILCIMRCVFYVCGADKIRGTLIQYIWICLAMFTIFMGSMLAFNEKVLKKRFAYSSVSQASYILLGLSFLNAESVTGSMLHIVFHAMIKSTLFLTAGAIIYKTGCTKVEDLRGIGKEMPVTMWAYTFAALALIGIPPANGFISKWYLATGMLNSEIKVFCYLGPAILLVSALLTAGYLLPISINGFLPGSDYNYEERRNLEPSWRMVIPLVVLASSAVLSGIFPSALIKFLHNLSVLLV